MEIEKKEVSMRILIIENEITYDHVQISGQQSVF